MNKNFYLDWGEVSDTFQDIIKDAFNKELNNESEAQTRFDLIDRIIKEILQWHHGQISVEEYVKGSAKEGYIDYLLICGDYKIIIEAKKIGAAFPNPSKRKKFKLTGTILGEGEISKAITQAESYASEKDADVVVVTNGDCWCYYDFKNITNRDEVYANILFPFIDISDAEELFNIFSCQNVANDSLLKLNNENPFIVKNTLLSVIKDADARIGRNEIADFISPALDNAISGESIINDEEKLKYCFVTTEARTKYDSTLKIYLSDKKTDSVLPAKRIKKDKVSNDEFSQDIKNKETNTIRPVTLLIGSVGSGKSTYLSHFEKVHGKELLDSKSCYWIYIDFEKMGSTGDPRKFIYESLRDYTLKEHPHVKTDFKSLIEPAYKSEVDALARGPMNITANNKEKFNEIIQELILKDYKDIEPYVEKLFSYISKNHLCVIVLDNIDLYENTELEVNVFSEGIALSKKVNCNVIVSVRDTTFVKHKNDSIFNAFELKKFWLDPPPFREVLSKRLKYAGSILKNKKAILPFGNMNLNIEDLSVFFEIAHSSVLKENAARFIECISDGDIRKGISLVSSFLTSGHIQANRALQNYIMQQVIRPLPFHEVFKGSSLGQWKYYKEDRAEIINILNSGYNSISQQFLRIYLLSFLFNRAKDKNTTDTPVSLLIETFSQIGSSENHICNTLEFLRKNKLINSIDSSPILNNSIVHITLSGGYYFDSLLNRFEYIETVMFDTPIFIDSYWDELHALTDEIEYETNIIKRLSLRTERVKKFLGYIENVENDNIKQNGLNYLSFNSILKTSLDYQISNIMYKAKQYYS